MTKLIPVMLRLREDSIIKLRELRTQGYLPSQLCRLFIERGLSALKKNDSANQEIKGVEI